MTQFCEVIMFSYIDDDEEEEEEDGGMGVCVYVYIKWRALGNVCLLSWAHAAHSLSHKFSSFFYSSAQHGTSYHR